MPYEMRIVIQKAYDRGTVTATMTHDSPGWQSDDPCFQMLLDYFGPRTKRKHSYSPWPARDTALALCERIGAEVVEAWSAPTPDLPPGTIY